MNGQAQDVAKVSVELLPDSVPASCLQDGIPDVLPVPCHQAVLLLYLASCQQLLPTADGSLTVLSECSPMVLTERRLKALPDCLMENQMALMPAACYQKEQTMALSDTKMMAVLPAVGSAKTKMVLTGHCQKACFEEKTVW